MTVEKDKKGPCWVISHKRSGYHESISVTSEELGELYFMLKNIV